MADRTAPATFQVGDRTVHFPTLLDNGFVRRTGGVLFAIFRRDDAYLVDILAHPSEANSAAQRILEVVVRTWPDAGLVWGSEFAAGVTQERSGALGAAQRRHQRRGRH